MLDIDIDNHVIIVPQRKEEDEEKQTGSGGGHEDDRENDFYINGYTAPLKSLAMMSREIPLGEMYALPRQQLKGLTPWKKNFS